MIDKKISNEFQNNGVVLLKKIIDQKWIEELRKGIEYNFQNPSEYKCVYEEVDDKEIFYDDYCNWQKIKDINTEQSSLEEIFIKLIQENNNELVRN